MRATIILLNFLFIDLLFQRMAFSFLLFRIKNIKDKKKNFRRKHLILQQTRKKKKKKEKKQLSLKEERARNSIRTDPKQARARWRTGIPSAISSLPEIVDRDAIAEDLAECARIGFVKKNRSSFFLEDGMRERVRRIEGIGIVFWRKQLKLMISKKEMYLCRRKRRRKRKKRKSISNSPTLRSRWKIRRRELLRNR